MGVGHIEVIFSSAPHRRGTRFVAVREVRACGEADKREERRVLIIGTFACAPAARARRRGAYCSTRCATPALASPARAPDVLRGILEQLRGIDLAPARDLQARQERQARQRLIRRDPEQTFDLSESRELHEDARTHRRRCGSEADGSTRTSRGAGASAGRAYPGDAGEGVVVVDGEPHIYCSGRANHG